MAERRHILVQQDEDGWWIVRVPSLPGCNSQGRTRAQAIGNIKQAIQAYIGSLEDRGEPVPPDASIETDLVVVP
jgi:predicted RNase H-like HicB family nuclease